MIMCLKKSVLLITIMEKEMYMLLQGRKGQVLVKLHSTQGTQQN